MVLQTLAPINAAPLRRALSAPFAARPPSLPPGRVEGPLSVNPSGILLRGRTVVGAAADAGTMDWLTQAFPSPIALSDVAVAPLGYGAADTVSLLTEALPAILWLDEVDTQAVVLLGLPLGRLDATQELLNARGLKERRARVHGAKRVATAAAAWLVPAEPSAGSLAAAGQRLSETFGAEPAGAVMVWPGGERAASRLPRWPVLRACLDTAPLDPEGAPLPHLAAALAGASVILTPSGRWERLARLFPGATAMTIAGDNAAGTHPVTAASALRRLRLRARNAHGRRAER